MPKPFLSPSPPLPQAGGLQQLDPTCKAKPASAIAARLLVGSSQKTPR